MNPYGEHEMPGAAATRGGRILVIDDQAPNRMLLRHLLVQAGHEVFEAADGRQGFDAAVSLLPDVILVDVVMPGLSGFDVCRQLRAAPATEHLPVIMVTAKGSVEDIEQGFQVGATDYIPRPFKPRELLARVRNALEIKRGHDGLRSWNRRMRRELALAGALQQSILRTAPLLTEHAEAWIAYRPSLIVSGDLFDALQLADGRICVYVGDVSGHGVGPAMLSSMLKAILTEMLKELGGEGLPALMNQLHQRFRRYVEDPALYATFFTALFDPKTRRLRCMNCGHPRPLLMRPGRRVASEELEPGGGIPIGFALADGPPYDDGQEVVLELEPGCAMFIYTDGITEARMRATGEECGIAHLTELARDCAAPEAALNPAASVLTCLGREGYELDADDCSLICLTLPDPRCPTLRRAIAPTLDDVFDLAHSAGEVIETAGWPQQTAAAIELLVAEHATNIVKHGRLPAGGAIRLDLRVGDETCRVRIDDDGKEWDHEACIRSAQEMDDTAESGRGLRIMRAIASESAIFRRDNRNVACFAVARDAGLRSPDAEHAQP